MFFLGMNFELILMEDLDLIACLDTDWKSIASIDIFLIMNPFFFLCFEKKFSDLNNAERYDNTDGEKGEVLKFWVTCFNFNNFFRNVQKFS